MGLGPSGRIFGSKSQSPVLAGLPSSPAAACPQRCFPFSGNEKHPPGSPSCSDWLLTRSRPRGGQGAVPSPGLECAVGRGDSEPVQGRCGRGACGPATECGRGSEETPCGGKRPRCSGSGCRRLLGRQEKGVQGVHRNNCRGSWQGRAERLPGVTRPGQLCGLLLGGPRGCGLGAGFRGAKGEHKAKWF